MVGGYLLLLVILVLSEQFTVSPHRLDCGEPHRELASRVDTEAHG